MATPARKSLASRTSVSRSSVSRGSRSTTRTASTRKKPSRTASTARSMRSGRTSSASSNRSTGSTRRVTPITGSRTKTVATRTQKRRANRTIKYANKNTFFSTLGTLVVSLCIFVALLLLGWFFILPSVLLSTNENRNIVYVSNDINALSGKILFAHINTDQKKSALYVLDGTEEVEVPNGYGSYAIGAVPSLLKMEQHTDVTINSIMSRLFGLPIDVVVMAKPLDFALSESGTGTDLSTLAGKLRESAGQTIFTDPQRAVLLLRLSLLAQQTALVQDLGSYQNTNALVHRSALALESEEKHCSVAVINTTGKRNLARETAQLLEQNGVYVVREDSSTQQEERTLLQAHAEPKPACESLFGKLLPFFPETSVQEVQTEESRRYRADIIIFLGRDITVSTLE